MLSGLTFFARGKKILRSVVICVRGVGFGVGVQERRTDRNVCATRQRSSIGVILNGLEF
jgi:hypothetical protein